MPKSLIILSAITAEIKKEEKKFTASFGSEWNGGHEHAVNLVNQIELKFTRKSKTYGFLKKDISQSSIPTILTQLIAENKDLIKYYKRLMTRLLAELNFDGRGNTTVGHVVFVLYRDEDDEESKGRLLVVMVDKKDVFDFDKALVPTQFKSIDVDSLRQAVRYDLTLFDSIYPEHVNEEQTNAYLEFISGRSQGGFFKDAFGGSDMIDNGVSVGSIFKCIEDFGKNIGIHRLQIQKICTDVEELVIEKNYKGISVKSIARKVIACLPDDCAKEEATEEGFISFLHEGKYSISEVFDVTRGQLQKATNIEGKKGIDYFYRIKKSALGNKSDKTKSIRYDPKTQLLTFVIPDGDEHDALIEALSIKD